MNILLSNSLPFLLLVSTITCYTFDIEPNAFTNIEYETRQLKIYKDLKDSNIIFVSPLAEISLESREVSKNTLTKQDEIRLRITLINDEIKLKVEEKLKRKLKMCKEGCDVQLLPMEKVRLLWTREKQISSDFILEKTWKSNTDLGSNIYFTISCVSNMSCSQLLKSLLDNPFQLAGLELEYTINKKQASSKQIEIKGSHVTSTRFFSNLPLNRDEVFITDEELNKLNKEIVENVKLTAFTDEEFDDKQKDSVILNLLASFWQKRKSVVKPFDNYRIKFAEFKDETTIENKSVILRTKEMIHAIDVHFQQNFTSLIERCKSFLLESASTTRRTTRSTGAKDVVTKYINRLDTITKYGNKTFYFPQSITTATSNQTFIYVNDRGNNHIIMLNQNGSLVKFIFHFDPFDIVSSNKELFVSDGWGQSITKYDLNLNLIQNIKNCSFTGAIVGQCLQWPMGLFYDLNSNLLYCADYWAQGVHVFNNNLTRLNFISFNSNKPTSVLYFNNKLYVGTWENEILVSDSNNITTTFPNMCPTAHETNSINIYNQQYLSFNCYWNKIVKIYHLNMTFTGKILSTSGLPTSITSDPQNRLLVTNKDPGGIDIFSNPN